ncbi:5-formyltetrahydrofolate cyclo-ligase [Bacillus sp. B1-b2]|nr:5-formyltetrahydrofolate cyclo-ligase [Bacillus sp. B1-b2]
MMKQQLSKLERPSYEHLSYQIAQYLYKDKDFQSAAHIGLTLSHIPEVDTYQLIRACWEQGKKVSVPKCLPHSKEMDFRSINSFNQLECVYSNLYEPIVEQTTSTESSEIDLLIVPGLIFSKAGYRVGFGGGYYDRYLTNFQGKTISLCFTMQLLDKIPVEEHDRKIQKIITNEGVFRVI